MITLTRSAHVNTTTVYLQFKAIGDTLISEITHLFIIPQELCIDNQA